MTISALNSSAGASAPTLVRLITGEYSAVSVAGDPKDATRLWLVKQPDGNFSPASLAAGGWGAAQSSPAVLTSLDSLKLGGD